MKPLWTSILLFLVSMAACSDMTGLFLSDWQNQGEGCAPSYFTITLTSDNTYIAAYGYSSLTAAAYCSNIANFTGNYSSNLSQATNGAWIDTTGQQLIYDETLDVFYFILKNGPTYSPYLYDRSGAYFPLELALGNIGGTWGNPTPLNSSLQNTCCVPDSLFVTIENQTPIPGFVNIMPNYSTTTCSKVINALSQANIFTPSTDKLNWTTFDSTLRVLSDYLFDPYNAAQLTVRLDDNNSCWYTYDKLPANLLSGAWYLDWQTANALYVPQTYTISIVNGSFMQGTLQYGDSNTTSYVVGNIQNQFSDSSMQLTFAFDYSTFTLLAIDNPYSQVLYSLNGSILPNNLGDTYWNNAQPEYSDSDGDSLGDCCVPNLISILSSSAQNYLAVSYTLPQNHACDAITPEALANNQNPLESTLNITTPSLTLVTWSDERYSTQISFVNASTTSEILVSDFFGTGCTFKMMATSKSLEGLEY